ncbi:hypothetical protein HOK00_08555 [bacterium]|nr:hypothetical protein [bacterium]
MLLTEKTANKIMDGIEETEEKYTNFCSNTSKVIEKLEAISNILENDILESSNLSNEEKIELLSNKKHINSVLSKLIKIRDVISEDKIRLDGAIMNFQYVDITRKSTEVFVKSVTEKTKELQALFSTMTTVKTADISDKEVAAKNLILK